MGGGYCSGRGEGSNSFFYFSVLWDVGKLKIRLIWIISAGRCPKYGRVIISRFSREAAGAASNEGFPGCLSTESFLAGIVDDRNFVIRICIQQPHHYTWMYMRYQVVVKPWLFSRKICLSYVQLIPGEHFKSSSSVP